MLLYTSSINVCFHLALFSFFVFNLSSAIFSLWFLCSHLLSPCYQSTYFCFSCLFLYEYSVSSSLFSSLFSSYFSFVNCHIFLSQFTFLFFLPFLFFFPSIFFLATHATTARNGERQLFRYTRLRTSLLQYFARVHNTWGREKGDLPAEKQQLVQTEKEPRKRGWE